MKRVGLVLASVLALSAVFAGSVQAETIAIANASFESPTGIESGTQNVMPDSWVQFGGYAGIAGLPTSNIVSPPDASLQSLWLNSAGPNGPGGSYQVLAATLKANTTYTLTVDIGCRSDISFGGGSINLGCGSTPTANLLGTATISNAAPSSGAWTTWTSTFETNAAPAGLGEHLRVELVASPNGVQSYFDNVRLTASTVPEPGTLAILATCLIGLLAYAWRKRK